MSRVCMNDQPMPVAAQMRQDRGLCQPGPETSKPQPNSEFED